MIGNRRSLFPLLLVVFFLILSCSLFFPPTPEPEQVFTRVASTVLAQLTQEATQNADSWLIRETRPPTPTTPPISGAPPAVEIQPSPPSESPPPSPTSPPPTAIPPPTPCDRAAVVAESFSPSQASFTPGLRLTKTWRLQNTGTCRWTTDYALVFTGGEQMGAVSNNFLPRDVPAGQVIDLSLTMFAPSFPGLYQGSWMLRNRAGELFGTGEQAVTPLTVQVYVVQPAAWNTYPGDFVVGYCSASWQSGSGSLVCPGSFDDPRGSISVLTSPTTEARRTTEYALSTRPNFVNAGWISGSYPYYFVNPSERFLSEIGCLRDYTGCDVTFQLDYQNPSGTTINLGRWRETYDGRTTLIDIDLSGLAGQTIRFVLSVTNNGDPNRAAAFWLSPSIQRLVPTGQLVLSWSQETDGGSNCSGLKVYLTGSASGEARAYNCRGTERELGRMALTSSDLDQVLEWYRLFHDFDAEVYRATTANAVASFIGFKGRGQDDASESDINTMDSFALRLYNMIAP